MTPGFDLLRKLGTLLRRSGGVRQDLNTVSVDFDKHADATEFFDTLVETGEPAFDAAVEDLTSAG
jgi:hypothetical protein